MRLGGRLLQCYIAADILSVAFQLNLVAENQWRGQIQRQVGFCYSMKDVEMEYLSVMS